MKWIADNPELAATLLVTVVIPLFSSVMHAIGNRLDARGFSQLGVVFHWIATRTPKREVVAASLREAHGITPAMVARWYADDLAAADVPPTDPNAGQP